MAFSPGFPNKTLYAPPLSSMRATHSALSRWHARSQFAGGGTAPRYAGHV